MGAVKPGDSSRGSSRSWIAVLLMTICLSALLLQHPTLSAGSARQQRIGIIGGGVSGLAAMRRLRLAVPDADIVLLEAHSKLGGRIRTERDASGSVLGEVGATFFHSREYPPPPITDDRTLDAFRVELSEDSLSGQVHPLTPLVASTPGAGLKRYNYTNGTYFDHDGTAFSRAQYLDGLADFVEIVFQDLPELVDERYDRSEGRGDEPMSIGLEDLKSYEDHMDPPEQRVFDLFCFQHIVQDVQAYLQDVSAFDYDGTAATTVLEENDFMVVGGYDSIVAQLLKEGTGGQQEGTEGGRARVVTDAHVSNIRWSTGRDYDSTCEPFTALSGMTGLEELDEGWLGRTLEAMDAYWCLVVDTFGYLFPNRFDMGVLLDAGDSGMFEVDRVVVTLPLGVLKHHVGASAKGGADGFFSPPLPMYLTNLVADLGVNPVIKALMCWDEAFWEVDANTTKGSSFFFKYAASDGTNASIAAPFGKGEHIEFINVHHFRDNGCLVAGVEGDFARRLSRMKDKDIASRLLSDLRSMFEAVPEPKVIRVGNWAADPFVMGGYSHWRVDTGSAVNEVFQLPVNRKMFFAGEHTSAEHYGSVHGALLSGEAAADKIAAILWQTEVLRKVVVVLLTLLCACLLRAAIVATTRSS